MHQHWNIVVAGPYGDDAVATLPGQFDLLRALEDLRRPGVSLVYRLHTQRTPDDADPGAVLDLRCVSEDEAVIDEAEAQSLEDLARVWLLLGYHVHGVKSAKPPAYKYHARLLPAVSTGSALPIKPDWSGLIDLMRRREGDMSIEMAVCAAAEAHSPAHIGDELIIFGSDRGTDFFRTVAQMCNVAGHKFGGLALRITIHSSDPIDDVFVAATARSLLGVPASQKQGRRLTCFTPVNGDAVVGCPEQLIRVWHAPYGEIQGRGLSRWNGTRVSLRQRPPTVEDGINLGTARWQGARFDEEIPVAIGPIDRTRHVYVVGKTGSGKTNLLKTLVKQDLQAGNGVAVIDPHGDLTDYALQNAGDRLDDVTLLDFSDRHYLPVINPLEMDVHDSQEYKLATEELLDIIVRKSHNEFTGPVFDDTTRLIIESVANQDVRGPLPPSIALALELVRTKQMREWTRERLRSSDPEMADRWQMFDTMLASSVSEQVRWVSSKFADFVDNNPLQLLSSSSVPGGLSIEDVYRKRGVLLVRLPDTAMGRSSAQFIGSLLFSRLYRSARNNVEPLSAPFFVYVDEFQRFVTHEVEELVAEARKFNVGLTLAHQNLRQLEAFSRYEGSANSRLAEAIFSNVGTMVVMKTSGRDVATFANEFQVREKDVRNINQYEALARAVISGVERPVFTLNVPLAETSSSKKAYAAVKKRMIATGIWRTREELTVVREELEKFREAAHASSPKAGRPGFPPKTSGRSLSEDLPAGKNSSSFLSGWKDRATSNDESTDDEGA